MNCPYGEKRPFLRALRAFACATSLASRKNLVQICSFFAKRLDTKTTFGLS